ncbi:MAG: YbfB/YjiJ family MFS transporter [Proteobacteria bacterium]|nr:YbfB/YjiJ family MFS transporter [Pseudomonadota bacterium]MBU1418361.1 YbfB/YjiJ family MFS transporter [Pseudomonadota bacterium]MBU1455381.1 YbfB/YjiJ family MFS transporter [Pseudomonadota bacterium]
MHYGWIIVLSGVLAIVAVLGLGRFSLGMLLPSMGSDLELGYSRMGFIGTGNFVGYLLAVLISSRMVKHFNYRAVISGGIFLVGSSMIIVGSANGFWLILTAFFFTGIGSGLANVPVMILISHWFGSSMRGRATGLVVSGSGLGIMLTGLLVPAINNWAGNSQGWRINWVILGSLVLAIGVLCALLIRNRPQDRGLQVLETSRKKGEEKQADLLTKKPIITGKRVFLHLGSIYFFFGFTYVIYVTFVITTLINDYSFTEAVAGRFWFWFGLLGIFSGPLFGSLSDRLGRGRTLALVYTLQGVSHLLLALNPMPGSVYLSIALFALCAWSVPSIVAAAISDYLGPLKAASGFAAVTLLFGIGQITGPALAGILAERSGSFAQAYLLASLLTGTAAVLSLFLPKTGK